MKCKHCPATREYFDEDDLEEDDDYGPGSVGSAGCAMKPPQTLDQIVDVVLSYRPTPKSEKGKKRSRRQKRLARKKGKKT